MAGLGALGGGGLLAGKSLAVLGAGLLAGALGGGALVGSGAVHFGPGQGGNGGAGGGLQLVPCPDQGPVIGTIPRNQQVLVTAKSADGGWLQLYWPAPGIERAWTRAGPLQLEGDLASLPVARCEAPLPATPRPTVEPTATPEPTPTPTPEPTPSPTPTASPTAAANAAPKVAGLTVSTQTISYDQGAYCASAPKSVTFAVSVSDADGLASVNLWYRPPGATKYLAKPMTPSGGKYVATLDTTADNLKTAGELRYYVLAKDQNASPETTKLPTSGYLSLTVKVCKNTGPKITLLTATPTSIIANPLSVVGCAGSTLSELRARATDVDGVKGIKLFFKKPGATGYTGREFSLAAGTWYQLHQHRGHGGQHRPLREHQLVRGRHGHQGRDDEVGGQDDQGHALRQPKRASTSAASPTDRRPASGACSPNRRSRSGLRPGPTTRGDLSTQPQGVAHLDGRQTSPAADRRRLGDGQAAFMKGTDVQGIDLGTIGWADPGRAPWTVVRRRAPTRTAARPRRASPSQ